MIIIDTREQLPLWSEEPDVKLNFELKRLKLDVGDYTTTKLLNIAHAERKSPIDLYGSIVQGHNRFRREIIRALANRIKLRIFVECLEPVFYSKRFPNGFRLKVKGNQLAKIISSLKNRYGLEFEWCEDRNDMRIKIMSWFNKMEDEYPLFNKVKEWGKKDFIPSTENNGNKDNLSEVSKKW